MAILGPGTVNPCALTDFLANDYFEAVKFINRKFNALKRLAELLEQIGDLRGFIPNIGALLPLYMINLDAYANLVAACPFLNLPKNPTNEDIGKLQAQVAAAYARLIQQLNLHPWLRLNAVQDALDKAQSKVNDILNQGGQFMKCLQQACHSLESAVNFVADIAQTDFQKQFDQYTTNFVNSNGQVLNRAMQQKRDEVQGSIDQINTLISAKPLSSAEAVVPAAPAAPVIPQLPPSAPPPHA